jgi:hypothetical protein
LPPWFCAWLILCLCCLLPACSAFPHLGPFFRHIGSRSLSHCAFFSFISSSALQTLRSRTSHPLPCSYPWPIKRSFHLSFVLHSDYHLDPTNLPKTLKRARVTSATSVLFPHPPPPSVHFIANVPLLAQSSLPLTLGPILTFQHHPSSPAVPTAFTAPALSSLNHQRFPPHPYLFPLDPWAIPNRTVRRSDSRRPIVRILRVHHIGSAFMGLQNLADPPPRLLVCVASPLIARLPYF